MGIKREKKNFMEKTKIRVRNDVPTNYNNYYNAALGHHESSKQSYLNES